MNTSVTTSPSLSVTPAALQVEVSLQFAPETPDASSTVSVSASAGRLAFVSPVSAKSTSIIASESHAPLLTPGCKKRTLSKTSITSADSSGDDNNIIVLVESGEKDLAPSRSRHSSPTNQQDEEHASGDEDGSNDKERGSDQGIDPHDLMLLKVIGRGTFAQQVALAKHTRTQSMYVVKTLDKSNLVQRKQVAHTLTEKKVLEALGGDHPFIVKLYSAFQTERDLNFVLEYCQGGELFYHLQQQKQQKFDEHAAMFYAAEVLSALCELHTKGIVYRDLKPENVLLDADGHVKLADFGFAKQDMQPGKRTYSFCGSPEYLSPEMVNKDGHGMETDMWSFGCFCYELLTGSPPFQHSSSLSRLFETIKQGRVWYPPYLSGSVVSLLEGLLRVNPSSRLTAAQAMDHAFFKSLDWSDLLQRHVAPPIVPVCSGQDCTQNFDDGFTREPVVSLKLGKAVETTNSKATRMTDPHKRLRPDCNACGFNLTAADPLAEFQDF
ncbi:Agc protein kinase [Globisporangium polare]